MNGCTKVNANNVMVCVELILNQGNPNYGLPDFKTLLFEYLKMSCQLQIVLLNFSNYGIR